MRTLIGIALAVIGASSADAALQLPSPTIEKSLVTAAAQLIASGLADAHIPGNSLQAPASCRALPAHVSPPRRRRC